MTPLVAIAAFLQAAAGAQTVQDRMSAPDVPLNGPVRERADDPASLGQISPTAADLDGRAAPVTPIPQASTRASGRAPVVQVVGAAAGRDPRVPGPSPEARDACTEAALGRRDPPRGIDCSRVLQANSRPSTSELSAGDPLVASVRGAGNEVSIRRLEDADPEEIARRLASGYLVNAPAAQAVGSSEQAQSQTPSGITIIPDPSRNPNAPPPAIVNPDP